MADPTTRDEFALIDRFFAPLAESEPGAFGLRDDAAALEVTPGCRLVVTTDALVAGIHFLPDDPPDLIARKALRVNLSDLAAMGARPRAYTLAAILPNTVSDDWLAAFRDGLAGDQREYGVVLVGGDTVATDGGLTLSITAFGECSGPVVTRAGARPGDAIYVTGSIGDAALGLRARLGRLNTDPDVRAMLIERYRLPQPRVELGPRLASIASAMIDVSDGLIADLGHIGAVSGVATILRSADLPLSEAVGRALAADPTLLPAILGGGDDYELLFTAAADRAAEIAALAAASDVMITQIGRIAEGEPMVRVEGPDGTPMDVALAGFRHFDSR